MPPPLSNFVLLRFVLWLSWFCFAIAVVVDVQCYFFSFGVDDFVLYVRAWYLLRGIVFFTWWPTQPPYKGFGLTRIASHRKVEQWMVLVLVGPTSPCTIRRTQQPLTHQLTLIYPYLRSHYLTFLHRRASLNNANGPKTIAGTQSKYRNRPRSSLIMQLRAWPIRCLSRSSFL